MEQEDDLNTDLTGVRQTVRELVRGGYEARAQIVQAAVEGNEYDGDVSEVEALISEEIQALKIEQLTWPAVTDYDRLVAAFTSLEDQGVVCRENFTCCQTCGMAEMEDEIKAAKIGGRKIIGAAFFHQQDTERAVEGGGLYFTYNSCMDSGLYGESIGKMLEEALTAQGLKVTWNGSRDQRVHVALDWKKRWPEGRAGNRTVH